MPIKARQNSVRDNENNNDGSKHLNQFTGTGSNGNDFVAWTTTWWLERIPKSFMDRLFKISFCTASGFEGCKTSPPSNNADITKFFCADSNEQYGRHDNISFFGVEEKKDEDVYKSVVEVENDIGVPNSKQDNRVCHRLPSRNTGSRPVLAKFVRRETKLHAMTHTRKKKTSS